MLGNWREKSLLLSGRFTFLAALNEEEEDDDDKEEEEE
jgi:hypothetical protein